MNVPSDFVVVILARLFESIHYCALYPKHGLIIANLMRNSFSASLPFLADGEWRAGLLSTWRWWSLAVVSIYLKWGEKIKDDWIFCRKVEKSKSTTSDAHEFSANHWTDAKWNNEKTRTRKHADARRINNGFPTVDRVHVHTWRYSYSLYMYVRNCIWPNINPNGAEFVCVCVLLCCEHSSTWQSNLNSVFVVREILWHIPQIR